MDPSAASARSMPMSEQGSSLAGVSACSGSRALRSMRARRFVSQTLSRRRSPSRRVVHMCGQVARMWRFWISRHAAAPALHESGIDRPPASARAESRPSARAHGIGPRTDLSARAYLARLSSMVERRASQSQGRSGWQPHAERHSGMMWRLRRDGLSTRHDVRSATICAISAISTNSPVSREVRGRFCPSMQTPSRAPVRTRAMDDRVSPQCPKGAQSWLVDWASTSAVAELRRGSSRRSMISASQG